MLNLIRKRINPMENQPSSKQSGADGLISNLISLTLSTFADIISSPLKSGLIYFAAGIIPALIIGWVIFPMALYSSQEQPIDFNHALHMDPETVEGIEGSAENDRCLYCHSFREDGSFSGIPAIKTCMQCHDDPDNSLGETAAEKLLLTDYVAKNLEIPWLSYYRQPDCVYFSHIAHINMGLMECNTCHGDHGETYNLPPYKKNRITGYSKNIWGKNLLGYKENTWDRMKMDDCAECHTTKGYEKNNACFVCHK